MSREPDPEVVKFCGEPFAKRLLLAQRTEAESLALLMEEIAKSWARIQSPRSRKAHAAKAYLHHRWGSLA